MINIDKLLHRILEMNHFVGPSEMTHVNSFCFNGKILKSDPIENVIYVI